MPLPELPLSLPNLRLPPARHLLPLLGLGGAGSLIALARGHLAPAALWGLVALLLVAGASGPLLALWRRRQAPATEGPEPALPTGQVQQELQTALGAARQWIRDSRGRNDDVRRQPWFYLLGNEAAAENLLGSLPTQAPSPAPRTHPGRPWHFWFLRDSLVVQVGSAITGDDDAARTLRRAMLAAGRSLRPELPANGIVLLLPANLLNPAAEEQRAALLRRFRRDIEEIKQHFAASLPVYLLVSGCDALPGAALALRAPSAGDAQPDWLQQAIGHAYPTDAGPDNWAGVSAGLEAALHNLRLGWLDAIRTASPAPSPQARAEARKAAFDFGESLRRLLPPLGLFLEGLRGPAQVRGVYIVGGATGAALAPDLFTRLLPRDAALAAPARRSGGLRARLAIIITVLLCVSSALTIASLFNADPALDRAADDAAAACDPARSANVGGLIGCGERLLEFERKATGAGWLARYRPTVRAARLQRAWANGWADTIAAGLEGGFRRDLDRNQPDFALALALAQSASLLRECGDLASRCAERAIGLKMLGIRLSALGPAQSLLRLHGAHVAWLDADRRRQGLLELEAMNRRLWQNTPPRLTELLAWAHAQTPSLPLSHFWRNSGEDGLAVPGGFTAAGWHDHVAPALDMIGRHGAAGSGGIASLRDAYLAERQVSWAHFLSRFGSGTALWSRDPQGLKALLASKDSNPFDRLSSALDAAVMATTPEERLAPWARLLKPLLAGDWHRAQGWLRETAERLVPDGSGQSGYRLAADALQSRNSAGARDAAPLWRAQELLDGARNTLPANAGPDDRAALDLLEAAPRSVLLAALADAARLIDARWAAQVRAPALALPRVQRPAFLGGDNGVLDRFAAEWLAPFQVPGGRETAHMLGLRLPLSPDFTALVTNLRRSGSVSGGSYAGVLAVNGESRIGNLAEGPDGTRLEVDCRQQLAVASSTGGLAGRRANLFWEPGGCVEIRLLISLPAEIASPLGRDLVRRWRGPDMLGKFVEEMGGRRRTMRLSAFEHKLAADQIALLRGEGGPEPALSVDAGIQLVDGFDPTGGGPEDLPASIMQPLL